MGTLNALGDILVSAIPTFLLVWILCFYISKVFMKPLEKTMQERYRVTGGRQADAEKNVAEAVNKTAQYEEALRKTKSEIYRYQEQERQKALDVRAEIVQHARQQAEGLVVDSRKELDVEVKIAKKSLAAESEKLARFIQQVILQPVSGQGRSQ